MGAWKPLPYFEETCREALESYLLRKNFKEFSIVTPLGICFINGDASLYLDYSLEDIPKYQVQIGVGVPGDGSLGRESHLGLWALIPEGDLESHYWTWTWRDRSTLNSAIERIRDNIFPIYLDPILIDPSLIQKARERQSKATAALRDSKSAARKRLQAEKAFKDNDFLNAIKLYDKINEIDLTPADMQRVKIAKKRTRSA